MANVVTFKTVDTAIRKYISPDMSQAEVFSKSGAFLNILMDKAKVPPHGGDQIEFPIEYLANPNVGTIAKLGQYKARAHDPLTKGRLDWKHYYVNVPISEIELAMNSGNITKVIDIATTYIKNGMSSLQDRIGADVFSDGSPLSLGDSDLVDRLDGLAVAVSATATYGGIVRTTGNNAWWKAYVKSLSSPTEANCLDSTNSNYLPGIFTECKTKTRRGTDRIDLWLVDAFTYRMWNKIMVGKQQIMNVSSVGSLGFESLSYDGANIVYDEHLEATNPGTAYGINTKKWELHFLNGRDMKWSGMKPIGGESEGESGKFLASCNLVCRAANRQAVITGLPTS